MSEWNFSFFANTKMGVLNAIDAMMKASAAPMPVAVGHLVKEAVAVYPADDEHSGYFVSSAGSFAPETGCEIDHLEVKRASIED